MSHLLILYFGIIVITAGSINGHSDQYIPCQECLIHDNRDHSNLTKKEFCEGCIPNYSMFNDEKTEELEELLIEHEETYSDPCTDFYEYTCGYWNIANSFFESKWSTETYNRYKLFYYYIKPLLEKESEYDNLPFIKLAKRLYRSCMNEDAREKEGLKPVQQMLDATGGWPILMSEEEWHAKKYTWQNMDNKYFELYGFSILFDMAFSVDDENPVFMINPSLINFDNILKIKQNNLPYNTYFEAIQTVVREFATDIGIRTPAAKLRKDVEDIISFEKSLENIIKDSKKNTEFGDEMTIIGLQIYYDNIKRGHEDTSEINWLNKIQIAVNILDNNKIINPLEIVVVFNKEILRKLALLLKSTPQHVIINYLQWHVVSIFLTNVNAPNRRYVNMYNYPHDIKTHDMLLREQQWYLCIDEFKMNDALFYLFIKTYISANNKKISDIFKNIKEEMMDYIKSLMWLDGLTKNSLIQKIYEMSLNIANEWYDNQVTFTEIYKEIENDLKIDDNYFTNILAIIKYRIIKRQTNFRESEYNRNQNRWSFNFLSTNAKYDQWLNVIFEPAIATLSPYFDPMESDDLNYGGLATNIGYMMAAFIHSSLESYVDDYGNKQTNIEVAQAYEKRTECILRSVLNIAKRHHYDMIDVITQIPEYTKKMQFYERVKSNAISHYLGTQIAFAAFQKRNQSILPTLLRDYQSYKVRIEDSDSRPKESESLSQEQMFFIYKTRAQCKPVHRYHKEFINNNLAHVEAFAQAFNCPVGSPMNPKDKKFCKDWREATAEEHFFLVTDY